MTQPAVSKALILDRLMRERGLDTPYVRRDGAAGGLPQAPASPQPQVPVRAGGGLSAADPLRAATHVNSPSKGPGIMPGPFHFQEERTMPRKPNRREPTAAPRDGPIQPGLTPLPPPPD